jgi:GNAT superfamily N-acetyltransferase
MTVTFEPETVTLRDGTSVALRAIRPDDAPRLQAGFARLSRESIYLRFLDQRNALSDREAQRLASVDYHSTMAIVAVVEEQGEEHIIGVGRYATVGPGDPGAAEAAVTVIDDYQRRGLGSVLVDRIVRYARAHGIHTFLAAVHYSNAGILHFIDSSRLPTKRRLESGAWEIRVDLDALDDSAGS